MTLANMLAGAMALIVAIIVVFGGWHAQDAADAGDAQGARGIVRSARVMILACAAIAVLAYAVAVAAPIISAVHASQAPRHQAHAAPTCTYVPAVVIVGPNRELRNVTPCVAYVPQVPSDIWQYEPMCDMYQEDTGTQAPAVQLVCTYVTAPGWYQKYPDGVTRWTFTQYVYMADSESHWTIHYQTTHDEKFNASQEQ